MTLIFPSTSTVGVTSCVQYATNGDEIKEADETFTLSVTPVNSVDIIAGQAEVSITIMDDGDGENI